MRHLKELNDFSGLFLMIIAIAAWTGGKMLGVIGNHIECMHEDGNHIECMHETTTSSPKRTIGGKTPQTQFAARFRVKPLAWVMRLATLDMN
jgi:hypothetical protein